MYNYDPINPHVDFRQPNESKASIPINSKRFPMSFIYHPFH